MNELLDAVHEAINRAIVETPKGQRSKVTEAVITALHRALRADLAVRVRYQRLQEPGTTVTGILCRTPSTSPARSTQTKRRDGANCSHLAAQKIIAVLCFGSACCLLAVERESAVCAGRLEGESV